MSRDQLIRLRIKTTRRKKKHQTVTENIMLLFSSNTCPYLWMPGSNILCMKFKRILKKNHYNELFIHSYLLSWLIIQNYIWLLAIKRGNSMSFTNSVCVKRYDTYGGYADSEIYFPLVIYFICIYLLEVCLPEARRELMLYWWYLPIKLGFTTRIYKQHKDFL